MSLAELTALMSRVGRRRPDLLCDRSVALFVQECIEEAKRSAQLDTDRAAESGSSEQALRRAICLSQFS